MSTIISERCDITDSTSQDEVPDDFIEKLAEMDREITRLRDETTALKAEEKELRTALRGDAARVPMPELKATVEAMQQEKTEMEARLAKLRSGNLKPISAEEKGKIDLEHRRAAKAAKNRAKIRKELWEEAKGFIEKEKWEEVKEDLGLEF
jgi:26S proteasome regulatory subunit (ATPase 3-interacting protein)